MGYSGYGGELSERLITANNSFAPVHALRTGAFLFFQIRLSFDWHRFSHVRRGFAKREHKTRPPERG